MGKATWIALSLIFLFISLVSRHAQASTPVCAFGTMSIPLPGGGTGHPYACGGSVDAATPADLAALKAELEKEFGKSNKTAFVLDSHSLELLENTIRAEIRSQMQDEIHKEVRAALKSRGQMTTKRKLMRTSGL